VGPLLQDFCRISLVRDYVTQVLDDIVN
jgi:hypothetical protein